ncbi:MAG: hypothetical protein ACLUNO_02625 [Oscillospiraceae bacterium]
MTVTVGDKTYSKDAVRTFLTSVCGLRYNSRHFTVEYDAASDAYSVVGGGYGHNCGMSQWGAKAMAAGTRSRHTKRSSVSIIPELM